jgi:hypothetical protein
MKFYILLLIIVTLPIGLTAQFDQPYFIPSTRVTSLDSLGQSYNNLQLNHSMGCYFSSSGSSFSWIGTTGRYHPYQNLVMDVNLSLISDLNSWGTNYLLSSGIVTYQINPKMNITVGFQAPAVKIETNQSNQIRW